MGDAVDINNLSQAINENNTNILDKSLLSKTEIKVSKKSNNAIQKKEDGLYIGSLSKQLDDAIKEAKMNTPHGFTSIKKEDITAQLPELPYEFAEGSAVSFNGHIHILGGLNNLTSHYYYDEGIKKWIPLKTHTSFSRGCAVVCKGRLYLLGGSQSGNTTVTSSVYVWNIDSSGEGTDTWSSKASMPAARGFFGACSVNGKIYVAGGRSGTNYYKTLYCYDPDTNTWSNLADMPAARGYGTLYANPGNNNELYYTGQHSGTVLTTYIYDIENNTWADMSANFDLGEVYSYTSAGQAVAVNYNTREALLFTDTNVYISRGGRKWEWLSYNMNLPHKFSAKVIHNGELYTLGSNTAGYKTLFAKYEKMGFFNMTSFPTPLNIQQTACCYWNGKIHYFSTTSSTLYQRTHFSYTPKTEEWHYEPYLPYPIIRGTAAATPWGIFLVGVLGEDIPNYSKNEAICFSCNEKGVFATIHKDSSNSYNTYACIDYVYGTYNSIYYNGVVHVALTNKYSSDYGYYRRSFGIEKDDYCGICITANGSHYLYSMPQTAGSYRTLISYDGALHVLSGSGDGNYHGRYSDEGNMNIITQLKDLAYSSTAGSCAVVVHGKLYIFLGQYIQEYCSKNGIESPFTTTYDFGIDLNKASIVKDEETGIIYVALNNTFYKLIISN